MKAYLVDDEPLAVRRLTRLLEATGRFDIAGSTSDPEVALEFLSRETVDVLFLDIQMPGMTGFELLARLREPPVVIFTTAWDAYALKAFEVHSIDYLLKPIEPAQLDRAIGKLDRMRGSPRPDLRSIVEQVAASLTRPEPDRIATRTGERIQFIDLARVTHFFAQDKLTFAASGGRNYCVDYTIADLEERLARKNFVRIHRSTLVNVAWVQEMDAWFGGGVLVRLRDDKHTELQVARDRVRALKERLGV
ncbi:MAG: LytTR family DNA-binding domain-containing protein [Bryobacteraceae bacterium]|jgi:two-component system LytT family response regulator